MGGSACLLFSHLASQVLAFVPQLDIRTCGRPLTPRAPAALCMGGSPLAPLPRSACEGQEPRTAVCPNRSGQKLLLTLLSRVCVSLHFRKSRHEVNPTEPALIFAPAFRANLSCERGNTHGF